MHAIPLHIIIALAASVGTGALDPPSPTPEKVEVVEHEVEIHGAQDSHGHILRRKHVWFQAAPLGEFSVELREGAQPRARLNGRPFPSDRLHWDALSNTLRFLDETHTREFEFTIDEERGNAIRLGSWLQQASPIPERRFAIGVFTDRLPPAMASQLNLDQNKALLVTSVVESLPAREAGVRQFDVIVGIDALDYADDATLKRIVQSKSEGEVVRLRLIRELNEFEMQVPVSPIEVSNSPQFSIGVDPLRETHISLEEVEASVANPVFLEFQPVRPDGRSVIVFSAQTVGELDLTGLDAPLADRVAPSRTEGTIQMRGARVSSSQSQIAELKASVAALEATVAQLTLQIEMLKKERAQSQEDHR